MIHIAQELLIHTEVNKYDFILLEFDRKIYFKAELNQSIFLHMVLLV